MLYDASEKLEPFHLIEEGFLVFRLSSNREVLTSFVTSSDSCATCTRESESVVAPPLASSALGDANSHKHQRPVSSRWGRGQVVQRPIIVVWGKGPGMPGMASLDTASSFRQLGEALIDHPYPCLIPAVEGERR